MWLLGRLRLTAKRRSLVCSAQPLSADFRPVFLLVVGLAATACGSRQGANTATITLAAHRATTAGPVDVDATLKDPAGRPITGATVILRGDMTHAGMAPVIVQMHETGNGHYQAKDFHFTMAGNWVLTAGAALPDGTRVEQSFPMPNVGGR
jgi:hypothetical protein